jgi:hypothetical protein
MKTLLAIRLRQEMPIILEHLGSQLCLLIICPCPFFLREVVARFVDIGEIVYYHYLYFLFINKTQRALSGNLQSIDYKGVHRT